MTTTEEAAEQRLSKYKAEVGTGRARDIDAAAELIGDALAAWMQATKWGTFIGIDPGSLSVAALSRVRTERHEKVERNRRGIA